MKKAPDVPFENPPQETEVPTPTVVKHDCGTTRHVRGKGGKFGWYLLDQIRLIHRSDDGPMNL